MEIRNNLSVIVNADQEGFELPVQLVSILSLMDNVSFPNFLDTLYIVEIDGNLIVEGKNALREIFQNKLKFEIEFYEAGEEVYKDVYRKIDKDTVLSEDGGRGMRCFSVKKMIEEELVKFSLEEN